MADGTYHYVITLQWTLPDGGMGTYTDQGTYSPTPNDTRETAYQTILAHALREIRTNKATTLHFSLERNAL
ncbi:hypothetical protein B4N89_20645 [Embleya scabrispora]|uniref:Uncharacterized protein n=1 Tax=Embleya scabrispora TaxID=159449 RepID=A0A1T3P1Z8_9ACTN|nr:hypothetical protein [Embleya scabrispora]OPC83024.1 hypothetical protein B4N89_20645 [Embleya scabrispora]